MSLIAIIVFVALSLALFWALLLLAVSPFFRGMAFIAVGAILINIAHQSHDDLWMMAIGVGFVLFPAATVFRRHLFGE
jgi:hypothetical protein